MLSVEGKTVTDQPEIAEIFSKHYAKISQNIISEQNWPVSQQYVPSDNFMSFIASRLPTGVKFSIPPINVNEVEKELLLLNLKKATGVDNISPVLLRMTAKVISKPLCEIFNQSIINGEFPDIWKEAMVVPIFKARSNDNVNNYRPVSILYSL